MHETPESLVGRQGQVYTVGNGIVILQLVKDGSITEVIAHPDTGFVSSDFKTGEYAFISRVKSTSEVNSILFCAPCSTTEEAPASDEHTTETENN